MPLDIETIRDKFGPWEWQNFLAGLAGTFCYLRTSYSAEDFDASWRRLKHPEREVIISYVRGRIQVPDSAMNRWGLDTLTFNHNYAEEGS